MCKAMLWLLAAVAAGGFNVADAWAFGPGLLARPSATRASTRHATQALRTGFQGAQLPLVPASGLRARGQARGGVTGLSAKLQTGIVGLPNVGKSTLFNALLQKATAEAANFPFCTIEPNTGIVSVNPNETLNPEPYNLNHKP